MPKLLTPSSRRRALLAAAISLLSAGCIKAGPPPQCDELGFTALASQPATAIDIYDGNRDRKPPEPRVTLRDPAQIEALQAFLLARTDGWFIAAGETYDPDSRKANSVITAVFRSGDAAIAEVGYSPAFLETPGCDAEVILILSPEDDETIIGLLGETLPRASSAR